LEATISFRFGILFLSSAILSADVFPTLLFDHTSH